MSIQKILENAKELEFITAQKDPMFGHQLKAIEIVKEFIIKNKLILYGGTAIDYALRLKGDKIYPDNMLLIPDLDFMSPNSVNHAYELVDILYKEGFENARAITALHAETMRVDIGDNHFIADITFVPFDIFSKMTLIDYNGYKIIHPYYQMIDIHRSLTYPFDNPPREVIFQRLKKDINRYNKLFDKYPITTTGPTKSQTIVTFPYINKTIYTGFAAYAIITKEFLKICKEHNIKTDVIYADFTLVDNHVEFHSIHNHIELLSNHIEKTIEQISNIKHIKYYEPYFNMNPATAEIQTIDTKVYIYDTHNKYTSINSLKINDKKIRIINIQGVMLFMLYNFLISNDPEYSARYLSLLKMINTITSNNLTHNLFFPSIKYYGDDNVNLSTKILINRLNYDLYGEPLYIIPVNYYPNRLIKHPTFDMNQFIFYNISGKEISFDEFLKHIV